MINKKELSKKAKILRTIELFDEIAKMFPSSSLMTHDVDLTLLPKNWETIGATTDDGHRFWSADSVKHVGLTFFE